jgi:hypothetical protein
MVEFVICVKHLLFEGGRVLAHEEIGDLPQCCVMVILMLMVILTAMVIVVIKIRRGVQLRV